MKNNENEQIAEGLKEESMAEKVIRLAKTYEREKLYELGQLCLVKTAGEMAEAGGYFAAIRSLAKDEGSFKKFFEGRVIQYQHALYFIHCAEIVDRHPKFANLKSSRALRQLISLTLPNQEEIAERLADVPMEEINHVARAQIDRLHSETTKRKPQTGGRGPAAPLDLLCRWIKEIYNRLEKIYFLNLSEIEETDREPIRLELWNRTEATYARLKDPDCNPVQRSPIVWEHEPDDGSPVDCPEYDISHLKAREVRPVPLPKK